MHNREQRAVAAELAGLSGWRGCGKDGLRALADAGRVVTLPDGWAFVREGTPADALYVLLDGKAKVLVDRAVVAELEAGAIIGEMAFVEGGQRKASVATSGRVRALRIDYDLLPELTGKHPALKDMLRETDLEHRSAPRQ